MLNLFELLEYYCNRCIGIPTFSFVYEKKIGKIYVKKTIVALTVFHVPPIAQPNRSAIIIVCANFFGHFIIIYTKQQVRDEYDDTGRVGEEIGNRFSNFSSVI